MIHILESSLSDWSIQREQGGAYGLRPDLLKSLWDGAL